MEDGDAEVHSDLFRNDRRSQILLSIAVLVAAIGLGIGAYFVGKSSGEDLDAAKAAGTAAGQESGAARGTRIGYAKGFKEGREKGFEQTYSDAYREAYAKAWNAAGLEPPDEIKVPER